VRYASRCRQGDRICRDGGLLSALRVVGAKPDPLSETAKWQGSVKAQDIPGPERALHVHSPADAAVVGRIPVFLAADVRLNFECLLLKVQILTLHTPRSTLRTH
jgi:hypothetical protein